MTIRPETAADEEPARAVHLAAFGRPVEARVLDDLRSAGDLLEALSFAAVAGGEVVGHVAASRASIGGHGVVALGPIGVLPDHQRRGTGSALVRALVAAADAAGEPAVILLGAPELYGRFGFVASTEHGVDAPEPAWGRYFQLLPLSAWSPELAGQARYAPAFDGV